MAEEKVPAELGRLWRLSTGSRLGRPAELDVERVVQAAVGLADHDGLSGVTLLKVAQALDVTKMSLYRHVGSKDELFDLMGDLAIGPPPKISAPPATDWRAGLRQWALNHRAIYVRRPWLAHLPVSGPPRGPNAIGWMDAMLQVLRPTGLDWATKVGILNLVGGYARHASVLAQQLEKGRRDAGLDQAQVEQDYGRTLVRLVEPDRFPEAAKLFASPLFHTPPERVAGEPEDQEFVFGLELILEGVAATIDASPGGRPDTT
jgi:AcrR family transcriptional regulator